MPTSKRVEQIVALTALALLALGCFFVLRPFLSAILWAIILCFSTWPLYVWFLQKTGGPTVAAIIMTLLAAAVFVLPFVLIGPSMARDVVAAAQSVTLLLSQGPPEPPEWTKDLPVIGSTVYDYWIAAKSDTARFASDLKPYIIEAENWLLTTGASLGQGIIEVVLSLIISFFVYRDGRLLGEHLSTATHRFLGLRANAIIGLAGDTTRGVIYGILGTALVQGGLAAIGFWIAEVPGALFLGLVIFVLSFIPMGTMVVWIAVSLGLGAEGYYWWAVGMFAYGNGVLVLVDYFLKPYFISREGKLPFLLVFLGGLGGIVAFGLIGVFIGPVLLAIGFSLAKEWSTADGLSARAAE